MRWLSILALTTAAACAWWMAGRPGGQAVDKLVFNHTFHADQGADCGACHNGVAESTDDTKSYLPKEAACLECHDRAKCETCHTDVAHHQARSEHVMDLTFAHAAHVKRVAGDCSRCHKDIKQSTALPIAQPVMSTCLECHNHTVDYAEARCKTCHPTLQTLPLKAVAEFDHGGNWKNRHGTLARSQGAQCLQCHVQSMCADCHSRVAPAAPSQLFPEKVAQETLIHRGDFLSTHPLEAQADGALCLRCHQTDYCTSCHKANSLTTTATNVRNPHPAGYAIRGSAQFHGTDARSHVETCAACHDQGAASICVNCHKPGGVGGDPHPAGYSSHHSLNDAKHNPMCLACHI